ncbi:pentatricopeptide repeat-containing protein At3g50420 [Olea europaea var. sylvestris]|uniref:pentatricopeptide repeat-containing protein At3g50420 n=1 Tax=Olea europaea var. sylvestris TaxID=158386 RepID=UPI000C1CFB29|nr:pentatricopeptide repeat-containing protein At3g50420 [Olea europaea var. sylvestris]
MPPSSHEASTIATQLIKKCTTTTSPRQARQLHAILLTSACFLSRTPYLHNNILSMYAKCGSSLDCRLVFDKMPQRNLVSYNALISTYSRCPRQSHLAFCVFTQLGNEGLVPNGSTFTSLLQASASLEDLIVGFSVHALCLKFGFLNNIRVQTSLLTMYSYCGDMDCAKKVFCLMVDKDTTAWNAIISGYVKNDGIVEGLELLRRMFRDGICPTQYTYSMLLNAWGRLRDYNSGKIVHARVIVSGTYVDLPLNNALLDMYSSCSDTVTANQVFTKIENPDLVSWNSMIAGYSENGDGEKAVDLFVQLRRVSLAKPDAYTFAAVTSGIGAFPAIDYGKPLHAQIEKAGFVRSVYVGSTLISMYFSNEETDSAHKIFYSILLKDVVLWTDMIVWHSRIGDGESAIKFFHAMSWEGYKLESFALSGALSACADLATQRQGEMIHSQAVKTGNDSEITVCGSLVDMYAKNGELQAAESIFLLLQKRDLKCWNSMIGGYGHHGKAEEVFLVLDEMLRQGMKPDQVTFISLLAACSHCGLVDKGKFFWNYMTENGLKPGPKHYSCMISLLSRAGLLEEAEEMIIQSPFVDYQLELWRTLLSACVTNGNYRIGINAAKQILNTIAEDCAANVLLMKLYAATGRWDDVAKTRKKVKQLMLEKEPGLSWIEVTNNIHVFSSGDHQNDELCRLMGNLIPMEADEIYV